MIMTMVIHTRYTLEVVAQRCSVNKRIPVPEPLFNKVAGLSPATLLKKEHGTGVFL